MELKQLDDEAQKKTSILLIVPYGIETHFRNAPICCCKTF